MVPEVIVHTSNERIMLVDDEWFNLNALTNNIEMALKNMGKDNKILD